VLLFRISENIGKMFIGLFKYTAVQGKERKGKRANTNKCVLISKDLCKYSVCAPVTQKHTHFHSFPRECITVNPRIIRKKTQRFTAIPSCCD